MRADLRRQGRLRVPLHCRQRDSDSIVISLSKPLVEQLGWSEGTQLEVEQDRDECPTELILTQKPGSPRLRNTSPFRFEVLFGGAHYLNELLFDNNRYVYQPSIVRIEGGEIFFKLPDGRTTALIDMGFVVPASEGESVNDSNAATSGDGSADESNVTLAIVTDEVREPITDDSASASTPSEPNLEGGSHDST